MSVSGELRVGFIRCPGRYDNISFIIKTLFLCNQQKRSYFALASHDSLLLFIFSHFEVYRIENECSEKRELVFFFFFFFFLPSTP